VKQAPRAEKAEIPATEGPVGAVDPGMEGKLPKEIPFLRAFLHRLVVGCPALEVDDLQQQTMDRALQYQHRYDPSRPLRPWVQSIAFRLFLDARKAALREPAALQADALPAPKEATASPSVSREDVQRLLAQLPDVQQEVMRRFYLQEDSIQDIAAALKLSPGTVKSHLHRARLQLARDHQAEAWQ